VLARGGEHAEAERIAREAVAIGQTTDDLDGQGDARADLATVLELAGRRDEARPSLNERSSSSRKGNSISADTREIGEAALMSRGDEIRHAQRAAWAGLSAGWEKWDSVIMDQLGRSAQR
jgi:hypothetical protein